MNKLRIGLIVKDLMQPFWVYKIIENIQSGYYGEIVLVVQYKHQLSKKPFVNRVVPKFNLHSIYTKVEDRVAEKTAGAFLMKDINNLILNAAILNTATAASISEYKTDVILNFTQGDLPDDILKLPKSGIWSYRHSDPYQYQGGPVAFWEFSKKENAIGSVLEMKTQKGDRRMLYRSWSGLYRIHKKTQGEFYFKTSLFIQRKLKELYELGEGKFLQQLEKDNETLPVPSGKIYSRPSNYQFLKVILRNVVSSIRYRIRTKFFFDQWILFYAFNDTESFSKSFNQYKRIIPPKDRLWADPFILLKNDVYYIFLEELIYQKQRNKGHLSVMELKKDGTISQPKIILEQPYHLSYPFVFEHNDTYYMIPECSDSSAIQLYECSNFPYEWKFKMNLIENICAVDATLFFRDNKFWLFANVQEIPGTSKSEELFLFYSDNLFSSDWKSHPSNPIISDVRSARPAGRLFYENGKLIRPSQDCSKAYGYKIVLNEVVELTEVSYKEKIVSAITPDWEKDIIATHTLSFEKGLTMIDAKIRRRK